MYSPKIREELIYELYRLKQRTGRAMTKLVNDAIREYIMRFKLEDENRGEELS